MRWSYSAVSCYYQCPLKYKYRYRDKVEVERLASPAMDRGTEIHSLFEEALMSPAAILPPPFNYYDSFMATLREHNTQPEQTIVLAKDWTVAPPWDTGWVKSIIDAALVNGTEARNYDWKTGGIYDDHKDQRELYSIMQFCAHPEVETVVGMHVYVDKKENRSTTFKREQLPELKAKWEEKVRPLYEDEIFPANPSFSCRFCEFSKSNGGPCRF
jgi:CRISPR/Cas system-associated exonuclease Cas4 (RecB family)